MRPIDSAPNFDRDTRASGASRRRRTQALSAMVLAVWSVAQLPTTAHAEDPYAYVRVDADREGVQVWAGGNHPLGGGAYLASDVIGHLSSAVGQFDLGVVLPIGGALSLLPTAGIAFDFGGQRTSHLVPRLLTVLELGPLYLESWARMRLRSVFDEDDEDTFHTRNFLLFVITRALAVGPQSEITYAFHNAAGNALVERVFGGRINLGYGNSTVLGLFLGYDSADRTAGDLAGRFTFVHNF